MLHCRLCLQPKEKLRASHVLPDFLVKMGEEEENINGVSLSHSKAHIYSNNPQQPFQVFQRGSWEKENGIKEHLLCDNCERKFSTWETYVVETLYGRVKKKTKRDLGKSILPQINYLGHQALKECNFLDLRKIEVDYKKFKLFQLSLLWRAGISNGIFGIAVKLGKYHEEALRQLLLNDTPGEWWRYHCTLADIRTPGNLFDGAFATFVRRRSNGITLYELLAGGYRWVFEVASHFNSDSFCCLSENGILTIIIADGHEKSRFLLKSIPSLRRQ